MEGLGVTAAELKCILIERLAIRGEASRVRCFDARECDLLGSIELLTKQRSKQLFFVDVDDCARVASHKCLMLPLNDGDVRREASDARRHIEGPLLSLSSGIGDLPLKNGVRPDYLPFGGAEDFLAGQDECAVRVKAERLILVARHIKNSPEFTIQCQPLEAE